MIKKCESTDSFGQMFLSTFERVSSNQFLFLGSLVSKDNHDTGSASAFKRVVSQEQELQIADIDNEHHWFRNTTRDLNRVSDFDARIRDKESYIGKIFSRTFSGCQSHISNS